MLNSPHEGYCFKLLNREKLKRLNFNFASFRSWIWIDRKYKGRKKSITSVDQIFVVEAKRNWNQILTKTRNYSDLQVASIFALSQPKQKTFIGLEIANGLSWAEIKRTPAYLKDWLLVDKTTD